MGQRSKGLCFLSFPCVLVGRWPWRWAQCLVQALCHGATSLKFHSGVLCVHMWYMSCVYRYLHTCVCMCMYKEARGRCWVSHALIFHFISVRHGLSVTLNCAVPASLAVSKPLLSPASALLPAIPSTGVTSTCVAVPRFLWCGGDWSYTLVLHHKHSYLRSHLPSTSCSKD